MAAAMAHMSLESAREAAGTPPVVVVATRMGAFGSVPAPASSPNPSLDEGAAQAQIEAETDDADVAGA